MNVSYDYSTCVTDPAMAGVTGVLAPGGGNLITSYHSYHSVIIHHYPGYHCARLGSLRLFGLDDLFVDCLKFRIGK